MIIYFPKFYTEAHRTRDRQVELVDALARVGVLCSLDPSKCDLTFCGSIFSLPEVLSRGVVPPVIHYNWDLYPALVARDPVWVRYVRHLETCHRILVPNVGTAVRTLEIAGKMSSVVRSPVKLWDVPNRFAGSPDPRSYAVDVMRDYTWDANHMIARDACRIAGVPLVRTATSRPWDEFRWLVANASVLLSCYVEASTGGLAHEE